MKRAILLALNGRGRVAPNPMVGAVVVADGRIIGEGFHAEFGGPHAEVNAINSVGESDKPLLKDATVYVTLEPCSHHGKTPPCAQLLIDNNIKKVVIGSNDPNPLVSGKGVQMLRNVGIEVKEGVLKSECDEINPVFMTFHNLKRPRVLLKWAQSADGFMAGIDENGKPFPYLFSNPLSRVWMHRERADNEAIMVGSNTRRIDNPKLDTRFWGGKNPLIIEAPEDGDLVSLLTRLRQENISSLMVEGGPTLLNSFIKQKLFDEIRIETSPINLLNGLRAPSLPDGLTQVSQRVCRNNLITVFRS